MKDFMLIPADLALFDSVINKTTSATQGNDLSEEMKTYYSDYLIDLAEPNLVHDTFAQKHPIPKNGGKKIQFRKYDSLPKALTPLTEGVTPDGQPLNVSVIEATVAQYGGYITITDMLMLTAIDNNLVQATQLLASQAGRTLDTVTREVLNGGTNVVYAGGVADRTLLEGGSSTAANNKYLTVDDVRKAVRALRVMNAEKINGYYAGIIHPDAAYDLMSDPAWKAPHQYQDTKNIYANELGEIAGVRFVESTEAKIFSAKPLVGDNKYITYASNSGAVITVVEELTADQAAALVGRYLAIDGAPNKITAATAKSGATAATITVTTAPVASITANDKIYAGEAGKAARDVYSTLIMGANAYGVTEVKGGGLEFFVKQLGSAGTADPLNQRATAGWKAVKTAERLVEQYLVRVESASTFNDIGEN